MNDTLRPLFLTLLLTLGGLAVVLVVALVVIRATSEQLERASRRRRDGLRHLILAALLGEPDESDEARGVLRGRDGRAWAQVERQAFAMLPKIKGDSHEVLVALLLSRGAAGHAYQNATARSLVRRSRGAYQLGALGDADAVPTLLTLLRDKHFLVRRTAVRALGQVRHPAAVTPLLDAVTRDPALARDVVAALQRIGPGAAPELRKDLDLLVGDQRSGRRGALVATVLGLHGDIAAVPALVAAVDHGRHPALRAAAAQALGEIGVPSAVPSLVKALAAHDTAVRLEAATALGKVSDASAVTALATALGTGVREVDRAIAGALLQLGERGRAALVGHASPYAAEALAVHRLRTAA